MPIYTQPWCIAPYDIAHLALNSKSFVDNIGKNYSDETELLNALIESDKTTSIYNVSTRVLSKK